MHLDMNVGIPTLNNIGANSGSDMHTQTLRTLGTGIYMPPFGRIKPDCHDRHKTVPEFILILCEQMWM